MSNIVGDKNFFLLGFLGPNGNMASKASLVWSEKWRYWPLLVKLSWNLSFKTLIFLSAHTHTHTKHHISDILQHDSNMWLAYDCFQYGPQWPWDLLCALKFMGKNGNNDPPPPLPLRLPVSIHPLNLYLSFQQILPSIFSPPLHPFFLFFSSTAAR